MRSSDTAKIVSSFDENGLVIKSQKYVYINTGEDQKDKKEQIVNLTTWKYDDKNRILEEKATDYKYVEGKYTGNLSKRQVFIYKNKEEDFPPDYEYYEDNVLRTKTEYTEKDKYMTLIVFDEENSVKTYYENHIKVKDVFITNGVEKRVKVYE